MQEQQHTLHQYNEEIEDIKNSIIKMGSLVESQVKNAIKSLVKTNMKLASEVTNFDEKINKMEVEIDNKCTQIIVKRQPAAGDLRLIVTIMKIVTDLERIGDESKNIAEYTVKLIKKNEDTELYNELTDFGNKVRIILSNSLEAFTRMDLTQAINNMNKSTKIDDEFNKISRILITYMMEDSKNIKNILRVTWCARALDRIGSHANNLNQYIVYLIKGDDVRHISNKKITKRYINKK